MIEHFSNLKHENKTKHKYQLQDHELSPKVPILFVPKQPWSSKEKTNDDKQNDSQINLSMHIYISYSKSNQLLQFKNSKFTSQMGIQDQISFHQRLK